LSEIEKLKKLGYTEAEAQAWIENYIKKRDVIVKEIFDKAQRYKEGERYVFTTETLGYLLGFALSVILIELLLRGK